MIEKTIYINGIKVRANVPDSMLVGEDDDMASDKKV